MEYSLTVLTLKNSEKRGCATRKTDKIKQWRVKVQPSLKIRLSWIY